MRKNEELTHKITCILAANQMASNYSPFHASLPFEHLGQSSLCVFYFRPETESLVPGDLKTYKAFIFR